MSRPDHPDSAERTLILAPRGRDAALARNILREAGLAAEICRSFQELVDGIRNGCELAIVTEEAFRNTDLYVTAFENRVASVYRLNVGIRGLPLYCGW